MKRKIPARKHHGIRDPIKQNEQRLAKIKDKINNPPEKDQHTSYKLSQFIKLKDDLKCGNFKNIKKSFKGSNNEDKPKKIRQSTNQKHDKKFKQIKKLPNETDEDYLKRVNRITTESLKESQYELKYGVNVIRNAKTGEIKIEKRPKNEIDEILEKKKHKKVIKSKQNSKLKIDPKLSKELIKQVLNEEKEEKKQIELKEFRKDIVKFGEVVHAPPVLTLPRKAKQNDTVPRPGKKNDLLLKSILNNNADSKKSESPNVSSKAQTANSKSLVDLKGKRKDLPTATRLMIEDQQNKIIQMYRQLKKNKIKD